MTSDEIAAMTPDERLRYLRNTLFILRNCNYTLTDEQKELVRKLEKYVANPAIYEGGAVSE